jgi:hypothetical protein
MKHEITAAELHVMLFFIFYQFCSMLFVIIKHDPEYERLLQVEYNVTANERKSIETYGPKLYGKSVSLTWQRVFPIENQE